MPMGGTMTSDYWSRVLDRQTVTRRKVLAVAGGLTGAALIAACGGSSSNGSSSGTSSGGGSSSSSTSSGATSASNLQNQEPFTPSAGTPQPGGRYVFQYSNAPSY